MQMQDFHYFSWEAFTEQIKWPILHWFHIYQKTRKRKSIGNCENNVYIV